MTYLIHLLIMLGIYVTLAYSLDLVAGYAGRFSIAHAAFWGIGAYAAAIGSTALSLGFVESLVLAVVVGGAGGLLIGLVALRVHGDYFVIVTLAFQFIFFNLVRNWVGLTGGPLGIAGIPEPTVFGLSLSSKAAFLTAVALGTLGVVWLVQRIASSPYGQVLRAIREDEVFVESVGRNTLYYKLTAFIVSAALAAVAGCFYAYYLSFIDPMSFTLNDSIFLLSVVIVGGAGSRWGPLTGAIVLVTLSEALRFLGLPGSAAANLRQILYGGLLVAMMMFRPCGLVGRYAFGR